MAEYFLTSSEEMDSFQPGDTSITITAALVRFDQRRQRANAPPPRVHVLRGILSNRNGREVRVLFWEDRATEFEGRIYHQVLRISRPRVVLANPAYVDSTQNLMAIEISIQPNTQVDILGPMAVEPVPVGPAFNNVALHEVGPMLGPVRIVCFIRYQIARQTVNNFIFGSGALTDGVHHLYINVTGFDEGQSPQPGSHVSIVGDLRRNNFDTQILQVADMQAIQVIDDIVMPAAGLRNGFRVPPRTPEGVIAAAALVAAQNLNEQAALAMPFQQEPVRMQQVQAALPVQQVQVLVQQVQVPVQQVQAAVPVQQAQVQVAMPVQQVQTAVPVQQVQAAVPVQQAQVQVAMPVQQVQVPVQQVQAAVPVQQAQVQVAMPVQRARPMIPIQQVPSGMAIRFLYLK